MLLYYIVDIVMVNLAFFNIYVLYTYHPATQENQLYIIFMLKVEDSILIVITAPAWLVVHGEIRIKELVVKTTNNNDQTINRKDRNTCPLLDCPLIRRIQLLIG